jgi:hypothetical protein
VLRFTCPSCQKLVSAKEGTRGRPGICPNCKGPLTVPDAPPGQDEESLSSSLDETKDLPPMMIEAPLDGADDEEPIDCEVAAAGDVASSETEAAASRMAAAVAVLAVLVGAFIGFLILYRFGLWQAWLVNPLESALAERGISGLVARIFALVVCVATLSAILAFAAGVWIKSRLLARLPDQLDWQPVDPQVTAGVDQESLAKATDEVESLGFWLQLDSQITDKYRQQATNFSRLFIHPEHHCFAELNQLVASDGRPTPLRFMIVSLMSDGWTLTSGNREWEAIKTTWIWRQPRVLWTSHPQASPAELLDAHLERRAQIVEDLGITVRSDLNPGVFFDHEQRASVKRKRSLQNRNGLVAAVELMTVDKHPRREWLGDYPHVASERSRKLHVNHSGQPAQTAGEPSKA